MKDPTNCEERMSGFGDCWDKVPTPQTAIVETIDPDLLPMIGLSAIQLTNLGLSRTSAPGDGRTLRTLVNDNVQGFHGPLEYPSIQVKTANGGELELRVYNAFGHLCHKTPRGVRISKGAAEKLKVSVGSEIVIL